MSISRELHESVVSREIGHEHVDPANVFDQLVTDDRDVCSRCFRVQFVVSIAYVPLRATEATGFTRNPLWQPDVGEELAAIEERERTDDVEVVHPPRVQDVDADCPPEWKRSTPPEKTVCKCGAVDDDGDRATLSREEAIVHAGRVSERLDELGVTHDRGELLELVREAKSDPDLAGRDDDVFRAAVWWAVASSRNQGPEAIVERDGRLAVETRD